MSSRRTSSRPTPSHQSSSILSPRMNQQEQLEYRELYELFATFDRDGNGVISIEVLLRAGRSGARR